MSAFALTLPPEFMAELADALVEQLEQRGLRSPGEPEPWISAEQAAEYMAKPLSRVYDLAAKHGLPHGRDGRSVLFRRSEIDAYLLAHRREGS